MTCSGLSLPMLLETGYDPLLNLLHPDPPLDLALDALLTASHLPL